MSKELTLSLSFGKEQEPIIDSIIQEMKAHIVSSKKYFANDRLVLYNIEFKFPAGLYQFGYRQGNMKPEEVIRLLCKKPAD